MKNINKIEFVDLMNWPKCLDHMMQGFQGDINPSILFGQPLRCTSHLGSDCPEI